MVKDLRHIKYRRGLFSVNDYFLSETADLNAGINYCIQCPVNITGTLKEFYTPLIDLTRPVESIQEEIYHRTNSEINSFLSNQTFEYKMLFTLSQQELNSYINLYNNFAKHKNIRKAEAFRLKAYNNYGILAISFIKQNNEFVCINFYRLTKERTTNLHSFTNTSSVLNQSQIGRAHRALHWLDILEFKKINILLYDFGGWYEGKTDASLLNINKFKEQFTKNIVKEYTGVIYKNRLLLFLLKFIR